MIEADGGILALAEGVASRYESPVPLEQIAKDEFIHIICDDYGSTTFDGLTWFEQNTDEFYIHLNNNPSKRNSLTNMKGRFTLAHELGHYFIPSHRLGLITGELKPHGSINFINNPPAWQIEREADAFASVLLMPSDSIIDFIKGRAFDFQLIEAIADRYKVSKSAAALRYADIGNHPIMIVFAVDGRIRWVNRSKEFPFWRLKYGSGRGDCVPENTVMGTYFYEKDSSDCRNEETVYAGDCFDTRFDTDNRREFFEWCIEYKNCAISVFWEK